MVRSILALSLCLKFSILFVRSRRVDHGNKMPIVDVSQQPQHNIEHVVQLPQHDIGDAHASSTIFAHGFNYYTNEEAVRKHFGAVGAIRDLRLPSRGVAVITYEQPSSATRAINELFGASLEGQHRQVAVKLNDSGWPRRGEEGNGAGSDKSGHVDKDPARTIVVIGFWIGTDDDALTTHFSTVGAIKEYYFQSMASAVIIYVEASSAERAVTELDGSVINGQTRHLKVKLDYVEAPPAQRALTELDGGSIISGQTHHLEVKLDDSDQKTSKHPGSSLPAKGSKKSLRQRLKSQANAAVEAARTDAGRSVYASGFDYGTDEGALEKLFGHVGTVESCYFQSKDGAVVTFVEAASAQRAVTELDGASMPGRTHSIRVKLKRQAAGSKGKKQIWTSES